MTKKYFTRLLQASLMCCLAVLFTACDDYFGIESNPTPAYLSMSDKPVTIKVGETFLRQATYVPTAVIEYSSSNTKVATVDNSGLVTGVAEGEATITATATGYSSKTGKKIYLPDSKSYQLTVKPATLPATTITTAPVATTGDILAGSATALVVAGVADGGTMMYRVTPANETKPTSTEGFSADIPSASNRADGTYSVWYYAKGDAQHSDSEIAATAVEVTIKPSLATPLTLEAITAGTIVVKNPQAGMQYSLNGGVKQAVTTDAITVAVGDKVQFYGSGTSIAAYYILDTPSNNPANDTSISGGTAQVKVYGNIMSLVNETGYEAATELTGEYAFGSLFYGNTMLTDISDLQLPATNLTIGCYQNLFQGCTGLTTVPEKLLPATTLKDKCYQSMFQGCTGLTTVPEKLLPATTLKNQCYQSMFRECTGLTTLPEKLLPAETLANNCYQNMFQGCTGLTTLPEKLLPATEMKPSCYATMFYQCTGLTTLPEKLLPAETLANNCYQNLFQGCTSLTTAPALPATTLADCCYSLMFYGCEKLEQTPHLAAETSALKKECYFYMFAECKGLTKAYVKANYTDVDDVDQCEGMFSNCKDATTSTFYSADAGNYKSAFGLNSWQTAAYE